MQSTVRFDQRQHQTLSPRLQHAVRLLQMSSLDFAQEVHDVISRNPFLEPHGADGEDGDASPMAGVLAVPFGGEHEPPTDTEAQGQAPAGDGHEPHDDSGMVERDAWTADGSLPSRRHEEGSFGALDLMPVRTDLRTHLHGQLNLLSLPVRDLVLAKAIVESLDDDGYLRQPLTT